jgi:hypothetical protein
LVCGDRTDERLSVLWLPVPWLEVPLILLPAMPTIQ